MTILGVEADHLTVGAHRRLGEELAESDEAAKVRLQETSGVVEEVRAVKDEDELRLLTRAVEIADLAMGTVGPVIEPGMTEKQIAWGDRTGDARSGGRGPGI